jgi:hypothetical protein
MQDRFMDDTRSKLNHGQDVLSLCQRCFDMTGTVDGFTALVSERGYQRYEREELRSSARGGCHLCFWTFPILRHQWPVHQSGTLFIQATRSLAESNIIGFLEDEVIVGKVSNGPGFPLSDSLDVPEVDFRFIG